MTHADASPRRNPSVAARRRAREQDILAATRALFDTAGVRDAQVEDIASAVGINRAIIYRHFTSKEELFALTLCGYLDELAARFEDAARGARTRIERLDAVVGAFVDFGLEFPAFVDCAQTLMQRTGSELFDEISESAILTLGRSLVRCLGMLSDVIDEGVAAGEFREVDGSVLANHMYASGLGALQLAHIGILVKEAAPGVPTVEKISSDQVREFLLTTVRALVKR